MYRCKCEYCDEENFPSPYLYALHKKAHELEDQAEYLPEGMIICPVCEGEGVTELDEVEIGICYRCKGKKFVFRD